MSLQSKTCAHVLYILQSYLVTTTFLELDIQLNLHCPARNYLSNGNRLIRPNPAEGIRRRPKQWPQAGQQEADQGRQTIQLLRKDSDNPKGGGEEWVRLTR